MHKESFMNQLFACLPLLFLCLHPAISQDTEKIYTVQVGTFVNAKAGDFSSIRPLGMVYAQELDDNLYRVFIGGYDEKAPAENLAKRLHQKGYNSATVIEIPVRGDRKVIVIQFETLNARKKIDWQQYVSRKNLFAIIQDDVVKLVTGPYPDVEAARAALEDIRRDGYSDAFVKKINTAYLQKITTFETGIKQPLIPLNIKSNAVPPAAGEAQAFSDTPASAPDKVTSRSPNATLANNASATSYITEEQEGANYDIPAIRGDIKRRSVLELQKALKAANAYPGNLDGLYGAGTETAYRQIMRNNRDLQKYQILSQSMTFPVTASNGDQLQEAVNNLVNDPQASNVVMRENHPIAKAYHAYLRFTTRGPGVEVNNLMNSAIQLAYAGKQPRPEAPFDYSATYAYNDLDQLLLHLYYVHMGPGIDYAAPCWLLRRHQQKAARAMETAIRNSGREVNLQGCDPFMEWEETRIALAIAIDLNGDKQINPQPLAKAASERARLYLASQALNNTQRAEIEAWNGNLWNSLNGWSALDPMHQRLVDAFTVAYHQTQIRLEDYFMNKGFQTEQAKGMALATLRTMVGPHLERFL